MKQWMRGKGGVGLAAVLCAGVVVPAAAQFGGGGGSFGTFGGFGGSSSSSRRGSSRLNSQDLLRQRQTELELIKNNLQATRARFEAGMIPVTELKNAELELVRAEGAYAEARTEAMRERRLQDLNRYVDVDLQGATVRQAAQALSKASGIPIKVDDKITNEARITVRGRGVPVAVLLDRLGSRANLMITPSTDDQGVELDVWPALDLDGERTIYKGPLAPWATEWGTVPITGVYQTESVSYAAGGGAPQPAVPGLPGASGTTPGAGAPPRGSSGRTTSSRASAGSMAPGMGSAGGYGMGGMVMPGMSGMPGMPGMMGSGSGMSSASSFSGSTSIGVGNGSIVVAEPGVKDGQPGLWLTVYKLSGTSLLKIGTGFHKPAGTTKPAGKPTRGGGSMPGMGGGMGAPSGFGGGLGGGFGGGFEGGLGGELGGGFGGAPGGEPGGFDSGTGLPAPAEPPLPAGPPMNAAPPLPGSDAGIGAPGAPGAYPTAPPGGFQGRLGAPPAARSAKPAPAPGFAPTEQVTKPAPAPKTAPATKPVPSTTPAPKTKAAPVAPQGQVKPKQ